MRDKIWMIGLFFLLMATLPLTILYKNSGTSGEEISNYDKAVTDTALDTEIRQAASLCRDDFCDEALRAVVILQKTNAAVSFDQKQAGADADAALTARVKSIYYSEEEILTLGGKPRQRTGMRRRESERTGLAVPPRSERRGGAAVVFARDGDLILKRQFILS